MLLSVLLLTIQNLFVDKETIFILRVWILYDETYVEYYLRRRC